MTKSNWLVCLAILCSSVSFGQAPAGDPGISEHDGPVTGEVFNRFLVTQKTGYTVQLQWSAPYIPSGEYFIVERSNDASRYETVSALKITDTISDYELVNNAPGAGNYYYRIKWIDKAGHSFYSPTASIRMAGDLDFKFYPNPADKMIIIRTAHEIEMQVLDANGTARLTKELSSGIQVINISALEKGNYVLRIADKESNRVFSSQFLKN